MARGRKKRSNEAASSTRSVLSFFTPIKKKTENKEKVEVFFSKSGAKQEEKKTKMEKVEVDGEVFYFPIDQPIVAPSSSSSSKRVKQEDKVSD